LVYEEEVDTSLLVETIFLYSTSSDPWVQTASDCGLAEFGAYWNTQASRTGVTRTIAHFLSGKNTGGGIAWIGVLCSAGGNASLSGNLGTSCPGMADFGPYFGAYGYSGSLSGNFDINNPGVVWDLYVVAHEIGHNFNSPHTHCYAGLGGNASPVDQCYSGQCGQSGCHCGSQSLPCGTAGGGCGTIMSYCHLRAGGYGNIAFTFGQGHPYGTAPERVPARMNNHVVSRAGINPSCLAYVSPVTGIFTDGFESGDLSAWSAAVP
jgi:hypothetical protein